MPNMIFPSQIFADVLHAEKANPHIAKYYKLPLPKFIIFEFNFKQNRDVSMH